MKQKRKPEPRNVTNRNGSTFAVFQHTSAHLQGLRPFRVLVLEKSIRETVPTSRVELIVSTFPLSPIFSATPT